MGIKKQNVVSVSEREEASIQLQDKSGTCAQLPNFPDTSEVSQMILSRL